MRRNYHKSDWVPGIREQPLSTPFVKVSCGAAAVRLRAAWCVGKNTGFATNTLRTSRIVPQTHSHIRIGRSLLSALL